MDPLAKKTVLMEKGKTRIVRKDSSSEWKVNVKETGLRSKLKVYPLTEDNIEEEIYIEKPPRKIDSEWTVRISQTYRRAKPKVYDSTPEIEDVMKWGE